jgi:protein TonB
MHRIIVRPLLAVTASLLIHLGLGVMVLAVAWSPVRMPVLVAELVAAEAPEPMPAPPPPRKIVPDRRPLTLPRPIAPPPAVEPPPPAAPVPEPMSPEPAATSRPEPAPPSRPEPPAPPRLEPEPPQPAPPRPPVVASPEPATSGSLAAAPPASAPVTSGPPAPPVESPGVGAATLPAASLGSAGGPPRSSVPGGPAVAAVPSDGVTQRALPRGGYQYRPPYPPAARRLGIQGTTLLHVLVGDTGRVVDVLVKQSAGHPDLDQAATDAVRRWSFEPARRGVEPVAIWVQLPFEFKLR